MLSQPYRRRKNKRPPLERYIDVLYVIKHGASKPTRIMYRANLSWTPLKKILNSLVNQRFIKMNFEKNRATYEITMEGEQCLKYLSGVKELKLWT